MDQRLLFLRRARGEAEERFVRGPLSSMFDQSQRGNDVGQRGAHFVGHAMEQDFLFLDFGVQALMRDDGFARPLQDLLLRLERLPETFQEQDRLIVTSSARSLPVRTASPLASRSTHGPDLTRSSPPFPQHSSASIRKFSRNGDASRDRQTVIVLADRRPKSGQPGRDFA